VLENRVEAFPSIVGGDRVEALIGEFLDDQRGGLAVVFDAEDLFARFRHRNFLSIGMAESNRPDRSRKLGLITAGVRPD
jgi:hypothetical protein